MSKRRERKDRRSERTSAGVVKRGGWRYGGGRKKTQTISAVLSNDPPETSMNYSLLIVVNEF
jgi:hypothetical protein